MLQISLNETDLAPRFVFDGVVPFSVFYERQSNTPTLFLQIRHGNASLAEIGLCSRSGIVREVVLTSLPKEKVTLVDQAELFCDVEARGVPVFPISAWGEDRGKYSDRVLGLHCPDMRLALGQGFAELLLVSERRTW